MAALFLRLENWGLVRKQALRENLFQARTISYAERLFREIASRLQTLNHAELSLLVSGNPMEQQQLVWLAICQRYAPIRDFAQEVLGEHYHQSRSQLAEEAFDAFYHRKAEWYGELEHVAPATLAKARRVMFRMLKECGLLNADNLILPQALSARLITALGDDAKRHSVIFPRAT